MMNKRKVKTTDLRGLTCPLTLIAALRELNECRNNINTGLVMIVFITDDRDSTVTIPNAAENMGYSVTVTTVPACYQIEICGTSVA